MNEIIEGHEFVLDAKPARHVKITHQCVCLLMIDRPRMPTLTALAKASAAVTSGEPIDPELFETEQVEDKCKQEVSNPDQAFCDDCEELEHHRKDNQMGVARNIHRENKEI